MTTQISPDPFVEHMVNTRAKAAFGHVTDVGVAAMAAHPKWRLIPLLVRCGGTRFVAPATNIKGLIEAIEATGDYVRDVSFPAQGE